MNVPAEKEGSNPGIGKRNKRYATWRTFPTLFTLTHALFFSRFVRGLGKGRFIHVNNSLHICEIGDVVRNLLPVLGKAQVRVGTAGKSQ